MTLPMPSTAERLRRRIDAAAIALAGAAAVALSVMLAAAADAQTPAPADASRIVAAGGAVTETLYALGLQDRIVGVDSTSLHPPEALKEKPNVGYVRALSSEGVLSLRPSVIVSIPNAGPPDVLQLIREAGVRHVEVPDEPTAEGVAGKVEALGRLTGAEAPAAALAAALAAGIRAKFAALAADRAKIQRPKRVLFILALRDGRPMVGGAGSSADAIIRLAGGVNAAAAIEGYKPMTDEAIIAAAPEAIVMMERGGAHAVDAADLFGRPTFAATPAAAARSLITMDGLYLLGFGPRAPDAARDLAVALHPELGAAKRAEAPK